MGERKVYKFHILFFILNIILKIFYYINYKFSKLLDFEDEEDEDFDDNIKSEASNDSDDIYESEENLEKDENNEIDNELQNLSDTDLDDISDLDFNEDTKDTQLNSIENILKDTQSNIKKQNKNLKGIDNNIFVSAEKFAEILEEHSKQKNKPGGTDVFNTIDGASFKQIEWEMKRHQKLRNSLNKNKRKNSKILKKNVKKIKH